MNSLVLEGQYIPTNNGQQRNDNIVLIGEKPSDYFLKHPELKHFGNYNNPESRPDMLLQKYIKKYLGQIYVTDMVKTQGKSGADFELEWKNDPVHKRCLSEEIDTIKPKKIGAMGRKVEKLLREEFPNHHIIYLVHPSATRYPKNLSKWDDQFKTLAR